MNIWAKVFFGFLAVLLLICIGGGLAFHFSGGTQIAKEFTQGISGIQSSTETVERLNREIPFEPPEDLSVTAFPQLVTRNDLLTKYRRMR